MNKRQRKKRHVGEFAELGFAVRGGLRPGLAVAAHNALVDRLVALVEARGLVFGGGVGGSIDGFVTRAGRGSASLADRAALASFLADDPDVVGAEVGPLRDARAGVDG